ncbi:MAG: hypothetical protein MJ244_04665 [Clostridia bacterium]|nr:hypothetical protein [Clostridia bacterium]
MAEYDRNFYSRKGNKALKFFLLVAMIVLLLVGANMVSETFWHIDIWQALDNLLAK